MTRPRLLVLYCGAGGCSMGYHRAGFDVTGVDLEPQPAYPFPFIQADALDVALDGIHAGPPCQARTTMSNRWRGKGTRADTHTNLIAPTRVRLLATGLPYVIENVPGARRDLLSPVELTGEMFGLGVHRPRLFESNVLVLAPGRPPASRDAIGVYGKAPDGRRLWRRTDGTEQRAASSVAEAQAAMGIDWCDDWRGIAEAVPPAYTTHIGTQLISALDAAA